MSDLKIAKRNEVFLKIDCDVSTAYELQDFFTFQVPGAQFTPQYRAKMWDGKIRLYNVWTKSIYGGLVNHVIEFARQRNYTIEYLDNEIYGGVKPKSYIHSKDITEKFIKFLKLRSKGQEIEIRDYQLDAVYHALTNEKALLLSPTASGKSLIIYCLIRAIQELDQRPILIVVPTTSLVEQMYNDFKDYASDSDWNVNENCHRVYQGKSKYTNKPITITTWQSVYQMPAQYFQNFGAVFGDEAHQFKAKSLTSIMEKCINALWRIGTTGTLDGTKTHKLVLEGLFGQVKKVTTTKSLMKENTVAKLQIYCILLNYPDAVRKELKDAKYSEEIDFLVKWEARNNFIKNLCLKLKGNTLILYQLVEKHGKILYPLIASSARKDQKVFFVYGNTDTETREEIREITEKEHDAIIIASYGTFSTGINIRNLHNVIFASPSKSRIRNLQSIGRGLRTSDTKDSATLYDIGDDLSWKARKNFTLEHMMERIKIYNEENFEYKLIKVDLK